MQKFIDEDKQQFTEIDFLPGSSLAPLAEPVPEGSIHRLNMKAGSVIPRHSHPADEYVYVLSGTMKTGDRVCKEGTFWVTPAHVQQGPHMAVTDVEIITIRLGERGAFESDSGTK